MSKIKPKPHRWTPWLLLVLGILYTLADSAAGPVLTGLALVSWQVGDACRRISARDGSNITITYMDTDNVGSIIRDPMKGKSA